MFSVKISGVAILGFIAGSTPRCSQIIEIVAGPEAMTTGSPSAKSFGSRNVYAVGYVSLRKCVPARRFLCCLVSAPLLIRRSRHTSSTLACSHATLGRLRNATNAQTQSDRTGILSGVMEADRSTVHWHPARRRFATLGTPNAPGSCDPRCCLGQPPPQHRQDFRW